MRNHSESQRYLRAIQGAGYSFGSPLGLLLLRAAQGIHPLEELSVNYDIYLYMIFGSMVTFIIFGYMAGKNEDKYETLSIIDPLTNLYNRRYFNARLEEEFAIAERKLNDLSLVILDIDNFKSINDKYGHSIGDKVLMSVSNSISNVIRKGETLARIGGEEFAIIFPDCSEEIVLKIIERVRKSISETHIEIGNNKEINVTVSAGIACYNKEKNFKSISDLFEAADKALYKAKETGRNKAVIATVQNL